jgi:hypothetical protein
MFFYHYKVAEPHLNRYCGELYQRYLRSKCEKVATCGNARAVYKWWDSKSKVYTYFMVDSKAKAVELTEQQRTNLRSLTSIHAKRGLSGKSLALLKQLRDLREIEKGHQVQHPAILGFCVLEKRRGWTGLETNMMYVSPNCRGEGIASLLYESIMKDGVIVISGYSHNKKSRRLWMSIVNNPKLNTWAHDIVNLDVYAPIAVKNDTFDCSLKLYEDIKKMKNKRESDIRIIAYNPRYVK